MEQTEAKRVIDLVEAVKSYIDGNLTEKTKGVVDLGNNAYKVGRVIVKHIGGVEYIVGDGVPVKAFRDGTYKIWKDLYFDSEGNQINKSEEPIMGK